MATDSVHSDEEEQWNVLNNKDRICLVCEQWCENDTDFLINFKCCDRCPQSYHKRCIGHYFGKTECNFSCNQVFAGTERDFTCCDDVRKAKQLTEIISKLYDTMNYFNYESNSVLSDDARTIYYDPNDKYREQELKRRYKPKEIFKSCKCQSARYKSFIYNVGDTIRLRNDANERYSSNIAIIKEIHVYNEPDTVPQVSIFWFWRELEMVKYLRDEKKQFDIEIADKSNSESSKKYIDKHLYLDIDFADESNPQNMQSIASVMNKVLIFDTFHEFMTKKASFDAYYGHYSFSWHNYIKTGQLFEKIKLDQITQKLIELSQPKRKTKAYLSKNKVKHWIKVFQQNYDANNPDDEAQCMQMEEKHNHNAHNVINVEYKENNKQNNKQNKENNQQNRTKPKRRKSTKKKDILERNLKTISAEDQKEMKHICETLRIVVNLGVELYGFKKYESGYLAIYKVILDLVKNYDESGRKTFIYSKTSNYLRDIHAAIKANGRRGNSLEMKQGICLKLNELNISYENNSCKKRKFTQLHTDSSDPPRKKLKVDISSLSL